MHCKSRCLGFSPSSVAAWLCDLGKVSLRLIFIIYVSNDSCSGTNESMHEVFACSVKHSSKGNYYVPQQGTWACPHLPEDRVLFLSFSYSFFFFLRLLELGDKEWETQACRYRMVFKKNGRSLSVWHLQPYIRGWACVHHCSPMPCTPHSHSTSFIQVSPPHQTTCDSPKPQPWLCLAHTLPSPPSLTP